MDSPRVSQEKQLQSPPPFVLSGNFSELFVKDSSSGSHTDIVIDMQFSLGLSKCGFWISTWNCIGKQRTEFDSNYLHLVSDCGK